MIRLSQEVSCIYYWQNSLNMQKKKINQRMNELKKHWNIYTAIYMTA